MPADRVTPDRIVAELAPEEVRDILGREIATRNHRDYDRRRAAGIEIVRETFKDGTDRLAGIRLTIDWTGPSSAPAMATTPRPGTPPASAAAVELVGMDL